jgi:GT2 family glycosyltransferase
MKYQNDLGIVIVNYNVRHFLVQCLQSIKTSSLEGMKIEIWVVDNASVDGSCAFLHSQYPEVHIIENTENKGFSVANNQAIRLMSSKFILLLNPDTILQEDTLKMCHAYMKDHPQAGALGVHLIDGSGKFLPESKRQIPGMWNSFCKLFYLSDLFPKSRIFSGYNLGYLPENEINEVEVLCGAFMFIRSSVLDETGLLDEAFFMYGEDIDLSHRILKAGYKIVYFPETSIVHFKGESTKKSSLNYIKSFYGAMSIYVSKHFNTGTSRKFTRFIHWAIGARALLSGIGRFTKIGFRQILDFLLILGGLSLTKTLWATYYFRAPGYYDDAPIYLLLFTCSFIWVFFLWFFGHYDKKYSTKNTLNGIFWGSVVSLSVYALLPEYLRASRAIIVFGIFWTLLITVLIKFVIKRVTAKTEKMTDRKNMIIVASKINALYLEKILNNSFSDIENIYYVAPDQNSDASFYHNSLSNLHFMIQSLHITDVIFSSDDVSFKEIIQSMSQCNSKVRFKIGGDNSLSILGSDDKNQQGQLYSFDLPYVIGQEQNKRYKRMTDIIVSFVLIPFIPFLIVSCGFRIALISNLFKTFFGKYTLVGYGGKNEDYNFLPSLKKGIIKYPMSQKVLNYTPDFFRLKNIEYAKNCSFLTDINVIWANLYKLGDRVERKELSSGNTF